MNPPKTLEESELFTEKEKESVKYFLMKWAFFHFKTEISPRWSSVIRELLGEKEKEFYENLKTTNDESVSDYLTTLKKIGKSPVTLNDIILHFGEQLSKNSIITQLNVLKKWNEVKEIKITVKGFKKTFYAIN